MNTERWQKIEEIYRQASERQPGDRTRFLDQACSEDEELKKEVRTLLEAKSKMGGFLETPALGSDVHLTTPDHLLQDGESRAIGKKVGPYKLEEVIASGGMGTVYLASRVDDFEKKVAVKLIRRGMSSTEILRRFHRERQALASLDHPNIARLLDGGTTEEGLPFLVMEYIRGQSIDRYCDDRKLPVSARLRLFLQIADAVNYAHRKLVVHRDIKPGNILVTEEGTPKLLDFGVVKILDPQESLGSTLTATQQHFFTPEYASPEQIQGEAISIATDIYSLGVVLFELLTGHRPYRLTTNSPREIEKIVCEVDPPRPSTVVARTEEITDGRGNKKVVSPSTVSATREGRPEKLQRRLAGDLDNIILMALRKEPERRYSSVEEFSADIRRHLEGHPVRARKGTLRYRTFKFIARNRTASMAAFFVLVLLAGSSYFTWKDNQRAARQAAAQQVLSFLGEFSRARGNEGTTRDGIRRSLESQNAMGMVDDLRDQPEELVQYADAIANLCQSYFLREEVVSWRKIALEAAQKIEAEGSAEWNRRHLEYAIALGEARQFSEAESIFTSLLATRHYREGAQRAPLMAQLARFSFTNGDYPAASTRYQEALRDLPEGAPARRPILLEYSRFLFHAGRNQEAEQNLLEVLDGFRQNRDDYLEAQALHVLGNNYWYTPRFHLAEPALRKALASYQKFGQEDEIHKAFCLVDLSTFMVRRRTSAQQSLGQAAAQFWGAGHEMLQRLVGRLNPEVVEAHLRVSRFMEKPAKNFRLNEAIKQYQNWYPTDHPRLAEPIGLIGLNLARRNKPELREAEAVMRFVLDSLESRQLQDTWMYHIHQVYLGHILHFGDPSEGNELMKEGLRGLVSKLGQYHPLVQHARSIINQSPSTSEVKVDSSFPETDWSWPFGKVYGRTDLSSEDVAQLDFEDDHAEKIISLPAKPPSNHLAYLWIHGKPFNFPWNDFKEGYEFSLRVNGNPDQVLSLDLPLLFHRNDQAFQWVPITIPVDWLRKGPNRFELFTQHDPDFENNLTWQFNNFWIGVDRSSDKNHSWWFSSGGKGCCDEISRQAMQAPKPLSREDALFRNHREQGYQHSKGELMIFLEIHEPL